MKRQGIIIFTLRRDGHDQPWGFRMSGGADLGVPLVIQRVFVGTPSEGELHRGDTILKINNHDITKLSHGDAHRVIKNTGNEMQISIFRGDPSQATANCVPKTPVAGGVPTPFASATLPRTNNPGRGGSQPAMASPIPRFNQVLLSPLDSLPVSGNYQRIGSGAPSPYNESLEDVWEREKERITITHQPYRTTPLVFPGAKAKRDIPTNSYLRHNTSPFFQSSNSLSPNDALMKQKVAESVLHRVTGQDDLLNGKQFVHKQFNSPIGLYSQQNIQDAISDQTGMTPRQTKIRFDGSAYKTPTIAKVKGRERLQQPERRSPAQIANYDPMQSETFKAVYEDEINHLREQSAVQPQPYKPKTPAGKPTDESVGNLYLNTLGQSNEKIQQSYTFNRVTRQVFGEYDF